ncbi:hypothetical protein CAPSP0001_0125 [Capnocytophaga sputigena ATCC 33612]|nr:hypothetical protein CAPSP0001_0125 [Capnocytophaga sputigena ATCC 33612]
MLFSFYTNTSYFKFATKLHHFLEYTIFSHLFIGKIYKIIN